MDNIYHIEQIQKFISKLKEESMNKETPEEFKGFMDAISKIEEKVNKEYTSARLDNMSDF